MRIVQRVSVCVVRAARRRAVACHMRFVILYFQLRASSYARDDAMCRDRPGTRVPLTNPLYRSTGHAEPFLRIYPAVSLLSPPIRSARLDCPRRLRLLRVTQRPHRRPIVGEIMKMAHQLEPSGHEAPLDHVIGVRPWMEERP